MSTKHLQTFLDRFFPSILREILVDLDDNLELLNPFSAALSHQNKTYEGYTSVEYSLGNFFSFQTPKKKKRVF